MNGAINWDVFTQLSSLQIQLHWASATIAFLLGLFIFAMPKGRALHITAGAFYMALMIVTSVSAFMIRREPVSGWEYLTPKGMTFIHIFVPVTLFGIFGGLWGILVVRDRRAHRGPLIGSYLGGLVIAGALTFLPERRMNMMFFGDPERVEELVRQRGAFAHALNPLWAALAGG